MKIFAQWAAIMALIVTMGIALSILYSAITTPCPQEDSLNCNWNAQEQGNGEGQSYVTLSNDFIFIQLAYGE
jgi:hypothetical protein